MNTSRVLYVVVLIGITVMACLDKSANIKDQGEWISLREGESCDWYYFKEGGVYGMSPTDFKYYRYIDPLEGIDIPSFEVCKGSLYAKDKNHVYYPLLEECEDGPEYGACYMVEYIIEEADPTTFKYIGNGCGVDRRNMYRNGVKIPWDDTKIKSNNE